MKSKIIFLFLYLLVNVAFGQNVSLSLQKVSLVRVIKILAQHLHTNVVVSPAIDNSITLELHDADLQKTFDALLISQGLTKWFIGSICYVAPLTEIVQLRLEEAKLNSAILANTTLTRKTYQVRFAKAEKLATLIKDTDHSLLSPRGWIKVDPRTNTITIEDTAEFLTAAQNLIKRLDIPIQQIVIEGRLASVDSDYERELGLRFLNESADTAPSGTRISLAIAKLNQGMNLDVILSALERTGKGELISSPSLFTANQEEASIEAGEEIPYQEVSRSGATSITFKKAVLSLKVIPQVLPGNIVLLKLQVNQDKPSNTLVLGVPTIATRQIVTQVLVKNGQTVVLGGIYEQNAENNVYRIPFLGEIPVIGALFRVHQTRHNKRELLIFVTPKIIT